MNNQQLTQHIKTWGQELGFSDLAICTPQLVDYEKQLMAWLKKTLHGGMEYMARYGTLRSRPQQLLANAQSVVVVRLDYMPQDSEIQQTLENKSKGYISRYALGRDYHKVLPKMLKKLAALIKEQRPDFQHRITTDTAPIMEKPLAEQAGLGWIGKSTNLISHKAGSWFFLATMVTNLPLEIDDKATNHCGSCRACLDICPTKAFTGPYQLDASRCISYLTIELRGSIPLEFRKMLGNRIYGCDDCQIVCPWNKFAKHPEHSQFTPRHQLQNSDLVPLFLWDEQTFLTKTQGSAIRRIGHDCWLRNIAVALGNAPSSSSVIEALQARLSHPSALVREHVQWALQEHGVTL